MPADPRFPASDPSKVKVITVPPKPKRKDGAVRRESKDEAEPGHDDPAVEEIKQAAQDDFEEVVPAGGRGRGRTRGEKKDRKADTGRAQAPEVPVEPEKPKVDEEAERRAAAAAALEEKRKRDRAAVAN